MSKPTTHFRGPDSTQISISLPTALLEAVNELAKEAQRPRSNLITVILTKAVEADAAAKALAKDTVKPKKTK
jgi:metal-responsive CopG/Arc/MetJ family transcriptional regulator